MEKAPPDRCDHCGELLGVGAEMDNLLNEDCSPRRRDRISSNEEERGAGVRSVDTVFLQRGRLAGKRKRLDVHHENFGMELTFTKSADLWRINVGLRRRARPSKRVRPQHDQADVVNRDPEDNAEAEAETSAQEGDVFGHPIRSDRETSCC